MALVAAGVVLLMDRLGGAAGVVSDALPWWPVALLVWVIARATTLLGSAFPGSTARSLPLTALAMIGLAATGLLLATTGRLPDSWMRLAPGLVLILLGALLAVVESPSDRRYQNWVTLSAALRRARLRSRGRDVQLVDVQAWFGQAAIDLRDATLHPGGAEVYGTAVGGSIVLRIPAGWDVVPIPVSNPTLQIYVPQQDPALRTGLPGTLEVSLTGRRGSLAVEWVDAPPERTQAGPQSDGHT
ncbi:hypothetical protein ACI799_01515 [Blastococcus sp. SYSU DS0753]